MSRGSFGSLLRQMARESARRQRLAEAEHRRNIRDQIQAERLAERSRALEAKEVKQRYLEEQTDKAKEMTDVAKEKIDEMRELLLHTLSINDTISFDSLRVPEPFPPFSPKPGLLTPLSPPEKDGFMQRVSRPSFLKRMIPVFRKQYLVAIQQAEAEYKKALEAHEKLETTRRATLDELRQKHERGRADHEIKALERLKEIDDFESCYKQGDAKAVVDYNSMVLERSEYPEGFPQEFRVAYVPESKELVIDYELPNPDIIPKVSEFRYVKSKNTIEEKPRRDSEVKELYQSIVASVALRTCHEIFEADQGNHVGVIVFNGFIQTIDPSTGKNIRPYLISLRATKERFLEIDVSRIDKKACLRNLGAQVSPRPYEVQPIKPIIEFDMVDKRFVEQSDILSDLESRPNLMDLNPFEFENLVGNLFKQHGLETKLTRSSRDGGVDVVAYDVRPVIGGKVVIQAKRYKNTVGVSAVRDLYGTMMNEGANKGILVTTSGYGPDAFDFAKDKPIELIDGGQLLYLLDQVGVKARIIFPSEVGTGN